MFNTSDYDYILTQLEQHIVIYLEIAKLLITGIFCFILKNNGVCEKLCESIYNLVVNKIQRIKSEGVLSKVSNSVPQCTLLGPILFLVLDNYINLNLSSFSY